MRLKRLAVVSGIAAISAFFGYFYLVERAAPVHAVLSPSTAPERLEQPHTVASAVQGAGTNSNSSLNVDVAAEARVQELWQKLFRQARNEPITVAIHRAAISGDVIDIVVARWMQASVCSNHMLSEAALRLRGQAPIQEQIDFLATLKLQCDRAGMRSAGSLVLRQDRGLGSATQYVLAAASQRFIPDAADRKAGLALVRSVGSVLLLDATSRSLIDQQDLPALGLSSSPQIPASVDLLMVDLAIKVAGCSARGDCQQAALNNLDCQILNACVADLRFFAKERIYGPKHDRAAFVKFLELDPEQLEARWKQVVAFVATLHS